MREVLRDFVNIVNMAECSAVGDVLNNKEKQEEEARICPVNGSVVAARRPLSDSSIKYEENAFQDSSDVILVNFGARRNSAGTPGSSDGDTSDEVEGTSDPRSYSPSEPGNSLAARAKGGTKSSFVCDCQQSQKAKRKAASKLVGVSSAGFAFPVPSLNGATESGNRVGRRRKDTSFINRVKKWFGDSDSPTNFENDGPRWPASSDGRFKSKGADAISLLRSSKRDLQKKERQYLIRDILAVTNCSYYWGKINRHEAEELLMGKPDGTFLLRDSAHKDHLFSVSFCRYNKTLHARVEQWDHNYSFDRESATAYSSISMEGLLVHYSVAEYCMFFEPMLVTPLHRAEPQPLMSLCRGVIGNCTSYQGVEKLPVPTSVKNYLKEYNYCIKPKSKKDDFDGRRKRNSTLCIF